MSSAKRDAAGGPWVSDRRYRLVDLPVRVRCSDPGVSRRLSDLLGGFGVEGEIPVPAGNVFSFSDEGGPTLRRNEEVLSRRESWEPLISYFVAEINTSAVAEMRCLASHAGVVADRDGVLAFPAESGGGKSTFVAACLLAGFDYVSDEALCLDYGDGRVVPYPKPISLDVSSVQILGLPSSTEDQTETLLTPEALGAVAVTGKLPLRHVLLMERMPGPPRLIELPRSEVVASLLHASFNHYKQPEQSFRLVTSLAQSCQAWRVRFEDPKEAALMIRHQLGVLPER